MRFILWKQYVKQHTLKMEKQSLPYGTLQREFVNFGNFFSDVNLFNKDLTERLIEFNFNRPLQSLGHMTPIEFHFQRHKVLPMCLSSTMNSIPKCNILFILFFH